MNEEDLLVIVLLSHSLIHTGSLARLSSILLVSLGLVAVPSARGRRQALQAPPISRHIHTQRWVEGGGSRRIPWCSRFHPTQTRRERRPSIVHWLVCSATQNLFFVFWLFYVFFCFAPHNIEVKQENHGTSQPSAKKVGTANGRVMISSSWLQLEEQLNFLIGPEWTFPAD